MIIIQSTFGNEDEAKNLIDTLVSDNHHSLWNLSCNQFNLQMAE